MQQYIGITVPDQMMIMWDVDSAQAKRPAGRQAVCVVADSDSQSNGYLSKQTNSTACWAAPYFNEAENPRQTRSCCTPEFGPASLRVHFDTRKIRDRSDHATYAKLRGEIKGTIAPKGPPMPQAVVDPDELRQFARTLKKFNTELRDRTAQLNNHLGALATTWRDQEQKKFAQQFDDHAKIIARFLEVSDRHVPYLMRKADQIDEYLQS